MKIYFVIFSFLDNYMFYQGVRMTQLTSQVILLQNQRFLESEYKPYISSQMQNILSMIDTCTTAIPY